MMILGLLVSLAGAQPMDTGLDSGLVAPPIVGGTEAPAGKWDDTVGIVFNNYVGCTGTLIGPRTVLTAAHCTGGISHVLVGATDWTNQSQGELIRVSTEIPHPDYRNFGNDIAVLRLESPSSFTPRPISQDCTDAFVVNGARTVAVGYGSTQSDGGGFNSRLMEVTVPVTDAACTETIGCDFNAPTASEIVAGGGGLDSCNGDSGGPLYLETPFGHVLIGVTSRPHYEGNVTCGDGGVYTRPDAYLAWIQQSSGGDALPVPSCNAVPEIALVPFDPVPKNGRGRTTFQLSDPDSTVVSATITTSPTNGTIRLTSDNTLIYKPNKGFFGSDSFVLTASDDHAPPGQTSMVVEVEVLESGCGCSAAGTTGSVGMLGLALPLLLLRRRSDASR